VPLIPGVDLMKVTHGKIFTTRAGKTGCYKYHNGKKHSFVVKAKPKSTYNKRRY
jgi:hypothetical protein